MPSPHVSYSILMLTPSCPFIPLPMFTPEDNRRQFTKPMNLTQDSADHDSQVIYLPFKKI